MTGFADSIGDLSLIQWAAQPGMKFFTLSGTAQQIVPADPYRVTLMFSMDGASPCSLGNDNTITTSKGFILNNTNPRLELTQRDHGLIVTLAWFGITAASGTLAYITQSVSQFPNPSQSRSGIIEEIDANAIRLIAAGPTNRTRRHKLNTDRWRKRQTLSPYDLSNLNQSGLS